MKLLLSLLPFFLIGCAYTEVREGGQSVFKTQADFATLTFKTAHSYLVMTGANHSIPTTAGGQAFKVGADSIGTTVVSGLLTGGLPWQAGVAAGASIIPRVIAPAAPVILQSKH